MVNFNKVAEICAAYQMGHEASKLGLSTSFNEFETSTENFYAWMLGHNVGNSKNLAELEEDVFKPN